MRPSCRRLQPFDKSSGGSTSQIKPGSCRLGFHDDGHWVVRVVLRVALLAGVGPTHRASATSEEEQMRRFVRRGRALGAAGVAAAAVLAVAAPASAGVDGPALYVDGQLYRTVGTPTDLSGTSAPAHAWDVIY